ncbi:MAG: dihydroorotate dehydrogenase electron transfer subunit [Chloroflexota bacterium]|nr:dihydroorotate dehydrogenase electron transfer subunit [Chloroflexota bacterium]
MKESLATILSNTEIRPGMRLLWAEAPDIASRARPGQFVMVRTSGDNERLLRRPLAVHRLAPTSSPTRIALLFSVVGRGTEWLARRQEGEEIDLLGPLGNGFTVTSRRLLLVAGGIGIAPLVALAESGLAAGATITLVMGAATGDMLLPVDLLPDGIEVLTATEDGSIGQKAMASELLSQCDADVDQVFACGPVAMYHSMAGQMWLKNKPVQVSMEARMGCGFGICQGCAIQTRQGMRLVCQDGPVFDLWDIAWGGKKGGH